MRPLQNKFTRPSFPRKTILGAALFTLMLAHSTSHAEREDREQTIRLEADQLLMDDANKTSTFTGNVRLTQGTLFIQADKIIVSQTADNFKRGIATGKPASFRQKRDDVDEYVEGYGERIEYDSKSGMVNFFRQAHIKRGQDEVRGDHIVYNGQTGVFQALGSQSADGKTNGRVQAVIQPTSSNPTQKDNLKNIK